MHFCPLMLVLCLPSDRFVLAEASCIGITVRVEFLFYFSPLFDSIRREFFSLPHSPNISPLLHSLCPLGSRVIYKWKNREEKCWLAQLYFSLLDQHTWFCLEGRSVREGSWGFLGLCSCVFT